MYFTPGAYTEFTDLLNFRNFKAQQEVNKKEQLYIVNSNKTRIFFFLSPMNRSLVYSQLKHFQTIRIEWLINCVGLLFLLNVPHKTKQNKQYNSCYNKMSPLYDNIYNLLSSQYILLPHVTRITTITIRRFRCPRTQHSMNIHIPSYGLSNCGERVTSNNPKVDDMNQ